MPELLTTLHVAEVLGFLKSTALGVDVEEARITGLCLMDVAITKQTTRSTMLDDGPLAPLIAIAGCRAHRPGRPF